MIAKQRVVYAVKMNGNATTANALMPNSSVTEQETVPTTQMKVKFVQAQVKCYAKRRN